MSEAVKKINLMSAFQSSISLYNKVITQTVPAISEVVKEVDARMQNTSISNSNDQELTLDLVTRLADMQKDVVMILGNLNICILEIGKMCDERLPKNIMMPKQ